MAPAISLFRSDARRLTLTALAAVLAVVAAPVPGSTWTFAAHRGHLDPGLATVGRSMERVIVQAANGAVAGARSVVRDNGGTVDTDLPIVGGFSARVPADKLPVIAGDPSITAVTANRAGQFSNYSYDSLDSSMAASAFVKTTGAGSVWSGGDYGQGVGIAIIDTGVSPMNDLAGRVVYGPDLSGEGTYIDNYGHGTVMAGAAAGSGADSSNNASGAYVGVAPKAWIVAVKVAGRNGVTDVSTVLQAMSWVSAYQSQFNIRVLNLSWGTPSTQDPSVDPLDYAVERLWKQGIVVVTAAGNSGPNTGTIVKPGDDPVVLTVGAYDDKQNTDPADDSVPSWSSRGPTAQGLIKPDIVTPGRYIIATRSFGSYVEQSYPKALYPPSYIRGSGTSEATAITSGLVALLVQAHPDWTPDQVKAALKSTASPMSNFANTAQGAGRVNVATAMNANPGPAAQQSPAATGLGSLDASRGGQYVQTTCPGQSTTTVIKGEIDVRCEPWNGSQWTGSQWTGDAWTGSQWTGSQWTGSQWTTNQWSGSQWTGSQWTGAQWTGGSWQGNAWTGSQWTGSQWTGSQWTGSQWTGSQWTATGWNGSQWTSGMYDDFLTAFWGSNPPWFRHLPGETSEAKPNLLRFGA